MMTAPASVALFCLVHARDNNDLLREFGRISDLIVEVLAAPNGVAALSMVVSYIVRVTHTPREEIRIFLHELGSKGEEAYMSAAQEWLEEGIAKGRAEMLLRQLSIKFGPVSKRIETRVRRASEEELDRWAELVLSAMSIREVFAD